MSDLVIELSRKAQSLGPEDRARLAQLLLDSIHPAADPSIDEAWDRELLKRIDEIERGVANLVPAEEAFRQVRHALR